MKLKSTVILMIIVAVLSMAFTRGLEFKPSDSFLRIYTGSQSSCAK
jgi:hypothetical protein